MAHRPSPPGWTRRIPALLAALTLIGAGLVLPATAAPAAEPLRDVTVSVAGTTGAAMGCDDWDVACTTSELTARTGSVYSGTFTLPAGQYAYKVVVDHSWDEAYGTTDGQNIEFSLATEQEVTFRYDDGSHAVGQLSADGAVSVVAAGDFQTQLGCAGTWDPACLGSWLAPVGGTVYELRTDRLTAGSYQTKAVVAGDWARSYPGSNLGFEVPRDGAAVVMRLDLGSGEFTVDVDGSVPGAGATAYWLDAGTLAVPPTVPADGDWALQAAPAGGIEVADSGVTLPADGRTVPLTVRPEPIAAGTPRVAGYRALDLPSGLDTAALLTGELRVTHTGAEGVDYATGVQIAGVVDALFTVDADTPLGVTWSAGAPTLRLWAPTAKSVTLDLATGPVPMTRAADGTWAVTGTPSWNGLTYRYDVEVYVPSTRTVEHNVVTDPYSVALTLNSERSVLVDLADPAFRPALWSDTPAPVVENPVDHTIYELHVRDFSIDDSTVPEAERGSYLAFTESESDGMRHLRDLAQAGLTTVHLLPTFDIASIEEDRTRQATTGDLSGFASDSTEQQDAVNAIKDADAFNWGYDPFHFSTPEGSYATTGNQDGGARVAEFRSMVGGLHAAGLQVVLDQVFNHTAAAGQDDKSVLDRVVPGYYHRLTPAGAIETSTCCQNLATENAMTERLMVDSVVTWARDYRVDGFRFDLMGHHSRENMEAIRAALDELTLAEDGVDGSAIYLYGEGWDFGEVSGNALFTQATQGQLDGTGIGTFSDRLRDAVRGGSPVNGGSLFEQGFGSGLATDPNGREAQIGDGSTVQDGSAEEFADLAHATDLVRLGLAGNLRDFAFTTADGAVRTGEQIDYNGSPAGYAESPEEVVSYVDAHDNETLFDVLATKLPADLPMADRVRMNTLSLATATLSQSVSFWHAGTDLLRSKSLDRDSYNSGDHFNALDWTGLGNNFGVGLPPEEKNAEFWSVQGPLLADAALVPAPEDIAAATASAQDLLRLRHSTPLFRLGDAAQIEAKLTFPGSGPDATPGVIVMRVDDTVGADADPALDGLLVVFNTTGTPVTEAVDGLAGHALALSGVQAEGADDVVRSTTWDAATGTVTVPARTVAVLTEAQGSTPVVPATITLSPAEVRAGESLTVQGSGFPAGEPVQLWLHSDPVLLTTVTADGSGAFTAEVVVPAGTEAGAHTLRAIAGTVEASAPLTVLAAAPVAVDPDPGTGTDPGTGAATGSGSTGRGALATTGTGVLALLLTAGALLTAGLIARRATRT
ncbi:pullulanase-type alpha-1,6-glucosidase [Cellulomonas fimi]|uniref:pullulanase-type alpha-1,6-glucosidase n=1 Tax=Cellulomonas sp. RIT-PI-Y TaxID=3035297 RepID=UPI0021DB6FBC